MMKVSLLCHPKAVPRAPGVIALDSIAGSYGLTNPAGYVAGSTEASFGRDDFFPCTNDQWKLHAPEMFALLSSLWNSSTK
jgi:hypothetical protein